MLRSRLNALAVSLREKPLIVRWAIVGGGSAGIAGGVIGLLVGLAAYPSTAWFAIFELGVPAGIVGAVVGFIAALTLTVARGVKRRVS